MFLNFSLHIITSFFNYYVLILNFKINQQNIRFDCEKLPIGMFSHLLQSLFATVVVDEVFKQLFKMKLETGCARFKNLK